jgi:hypothetical protein
MHGPHQPSRVRGGTTDVPSMHLVRWLRGLRLRHKRQGSLTRAQPQPLVGPLRACGGVRTPRPTCVYLACAHRRSLSNHPRCVHGKGAALKSTGPAPSGREGWTHPLQMRLCASPSRSREAWQGRQWVPSPRQNVSVADRPHRGVVTKAGERCRTSPPDWGVWGTCPS